MFSILKKLIQINLFKTRFTYLYVGPQVLLILVKTEIICFTQILFRLYIYVYNSDFLF